MKIEDMEDLWTATYFVTMAIQTFRFPDGNPDLHDTHAKRIADRVARTAREKAKEKKR